MTFKRRAFIKGLATAGLALPGMLGTRGMRAFAQGPADAPFKRILSADKEKILVVIRWFGGNDGLNTVVPYHDDNYYKVRGRGSRYDLSIPAESVLPLHDDSTLGLHPSFAPLHTLYGEGKMAIVQNVGYPNHNLSHFRSTDIWLSASDADRYDTSGWYARYLEEKYPDYPSRLPGDPFAIELGTNLGVTLVGRRGDTGIVLDDLAYIPGRPDVDAIAGTPAGQELAYVQEVERQSNVFLNSIAAAQKRMPFNVMEYPDTTLGRELARVARLIASGLSTRLYIINVDGFDTHDGHIHRHAGLLGVCADAMYVFQRDMEAFMMEENVCMMTISEFGRRVIPSGSGTDHGAAAPMFIIGSGVRGGVIGGNPDLDDLDDAGNLKMEYDFRQIYASVLGQWFGASDDEIYPGALPRPFVQLPIFRRQASNLSGNSHRPMLGECFPNPASSFVTVLFERVRSGDAARLSVHAVDGRTVLTKEVMPGEESMTIDTSGLPAGAYICELAMKGGRSVRRFVVRH